MKRLLIVTAVAFLLGTGTAGAAERLGGQVDPGIAAGTAAREFKQARAAWLGAEIASYRIRLVRLCFCVGPRAVKVTVRHGRVARVSSKRWWGPRTVPALFRVIGQAIKSKVAALDVAYDGKLGYVRRASIDHIRFAADDEMLYRITSFRRL